jgi:hypothetical protein
MKTVSSADYACFKRPSFSNILVFLHVSELQVLNLLGRQSPTQTLQIWGNIGIISPAIPIAEL